MTTPNKIYIAGPMTGLPDKNRPAFYRTAARLKMHGYDVFNPADAPWSLSAASWEECLKQDLTVLLTMGGIVLLPGWEDSKGARFEVHTAKTLSMPILWADTLQPVKFQKPTCCCVDDERLLLHRGVIRGR